MILQWYYILLFWSNTLPVWSQSLSLFSISLTSSPTCSTWYPAHQVCLHTCPFGYYGTYVGSYKWQKWSGRKGINHMFSCSFPQQINNLKVLGWTKTRLCMFCFQMFLVYPSKMRWWKFWVSRETCLSWSRMINLPTHHRDVQRKHYHTWRDPMRCTKHCGHHWIFSSWPAHIYLSLELPS